MVYCGSTAFLSGRRRSPLKARQGGSAAQAAIAVAQGQVHRLPGLPRRLGNRPGIAPRPGPVHRTVRGRPAEDLARVSEGKLARLRTPRTVRPAAGPATNRPPGPGSLHSAPCRSPSSVPPPRPQPGRTSTWARPWCAGGAPRPRRGSARRTVGADRCGCGHPAGRSAGAPGQRRRAGRAGRGAGRRPPRARFRPARRRSGRSYAPARRRCADGEHRPRPESAGWSAGGGTAGSASLAARPAIEPASTRPPAAPIPPQSAVHRPPRLAAAPRMGPDRE